MTLINFNENYKIDYKKTKVVEKKGKFDYISWAHCQRMMKELDPDATWEALWNNQTCSYNWDGFVTVKLTLFGKDYVHAYPILNNYNKSIENPNQFDINNAQMRGYAKLFSMVTGHGLSLFTGEDLSHMDEVKPKRVLSNAIGVVPPKEAHPILKELGSVWKLKGLDVLVKANIVDSNGAVVTELNTPDEWLQHLNNIKEGMLNE